MPSEEESKKPNYYSLLLLIARKILVFHQKEGDGSIIKSCDFHFYKV